MKVHSPRLASRIVVGKDLGAPMTWELRIERLGLHKAGSLTRTYGKYSVWKDGVQDSTPNLSGFMCEAIGPGANRPAGNGKRIEQGTYPLWTQFGNYRSIGYSSDEIAGAEPMPAIALAGTGARVAILIHPAHPPKLFLSSVGCLNPTAALPRDHPMDFFDSRRRVIALLNSLRAYAPQAFVHQTMTRIADAKIVISGEPMDVLESDPAFAEALKLVEPDTLPIGKQAALAATHWLLDNFGGQLRAAVSGKAYGLKHLCAIVCQETAYKWVPWIGQHSRQTIVERAVFDASGDFPDTPRSAFPVNTQAFRDRMGDALTDMLIGEANLTRSLQGWSARPWVYKGYGLFQYDLQHVLTDADFFRERRWYDFDVTLAKATGELDTKLVEQGGDLWEAIRAYNGRGRRAEQYRENVKVFTGYCAEVTGD